MVAATRVLIAELKAILAAEIPRQDDERELASYLYNRCYTESILESRGASADSGDLTAALAAANQTRATLEEGWTIDQLLDGGKILARKGATHRSFLPGEYLTHRGLGAGPATGAKVSIFLPAGSTDLQPGYYYAFSETPGEWNDTCAMIRFFWNVSAAGAPRLMEAITRDLNRFQVPFQFKCAARASDFPRRDAAVLYLDARYYPIAALILEPVRAGLEPWLGPSTPLFSKHLAQGLGFAEDPGESFGENRTRILAAAMSRTQGRPVDERLAELRRQFEQRNLSLDRPWLNPGSVDRYDFPCAIA